MNFPRQRVSVIVFFLVAFCIPWATWIVLLRHVASPGITFTYIVGSSFCSLGGVLATYIDTGRSGVRELARRCVLYRVSVAWWLYALFSVVVVHTIATVVYGLVHGKVGPITPMGLFPQWWLIFIFIFGLFQGPLGEELGWRGFLLPRLLDKCSPLKASVILGLAWGVWHMPSGMLIEGPYYFHTVAGTLLFTASTIALSILMTVLFLHTRRSVLLAIAMHWTVMPGKYIVESLFPASQEPPDWLRAVVLIALAVAVVALLGKKLSAPTSSKASQNIENQLC